jgi:hypothetical protein
MKYIIQDWAGYTLSIYSGFVRGGVPMEFYSFESAWDYILGDLTDRNQLTEEDYQEYYAVTLEGN